ncbi:MAG: hypothetical protein KAR00_03625 [Candidatus Pacebacteria bacterium]|nr:hypothetical protein [Candidatus Paceibacterota bacterium]
MDELKEILQSQYKILPQDLKERVISEEWRDTVANISSKSGLDLDSADSVETEVLLVLIGLEPLGSFRGNLSKTLLLPKEKTDSLANQIEQQIFSSARNSLEKIQKEIEIEKVEEKSDITPQEEEKIREKMRLEIEHPQKTPPAFEKTFSVPQSANIIEDKLGKVVKLPHENSDKKTEVGPKPTSQYENADPYREPIE